MKVALLTSLPACCCRYGEDGLKGAGQGMGAQGMGGMGDFSSPFDLFDQFFGGGGRSPFGGGGGRSRAQPGEDERYDLQLTFLEAVFGTK